jgi:hypothetical protein
MDISAQSQTALARIATRPDKGVTFTDLRKLDSDGDLHISAQEAAQLGIAAEDINALNQAYRQSPFYDANEVAFDPKGGSALAEAKGKEFDNIWREVRDAEHQPRTAQTPDQLRNNLKLDAAWTGRPQLKAMVEHLQARGQSSPDTLTWLEAISKRHGKDTTEAICSELLNYARQGKSVTGIDKKAVLSDALHDIAWPSDIAQANKGTCAATALQMKLALERPRQYVQNLTQLAQGQTVSTPSGARMAPNNTWKGDEHDPRSTSGRIMQNAIMNLGGQGLLWDSKYDSKSDPDNGLNRGEQEAALRKLFGNNNYVNESSGLITSKADLLAYVEDEFARGRSVSISFKNHAVLAVGIDKSKNPAEVIMNSWGRQYAMTLDEFKTHVLAVRTLDDSGYDNKKTVAGRKTILGDQ